MELFLMAACLSILGLAVSCLAFRAATYDEQVRAEPESEPAPAPILQLPPARFFADEPAGAVPVHARSRVPAKPEVPLEALLLQIENHVRLEQAAAESFLESPTLALLHSRTASPLVN